MMGLLAALACSRPGPSVGALQTDVAGLAERAALPPDTRQVRWMVQAARVGREGNGRADGRIFAWVVTEGDVTDWLTTTLGEPMGPRASWIHDDVANVLFTDAERAALQRNHARDTWKLGCVRFPSTGIGRGEFRGDLVLDCSGHLYLALTAH